MTNNDQKIPDINSKPIDPNNEEIKNQYQDILNEYSKHVDEQPKQAPPATETSPTPQETDPIIPPAEPVIELPTLPEPSIQIPPQSTPIETETPQPIESISSEPEIPQTIEPTPSESQPQTEEPISPLPPRPPQEPSIESPLPERESFNVPSSDESLPPQPPVITDSQSLPSSGIFKILFFISLFIFLSVSGTIAYTLFKDKNPPVNNAVPSSIPETSSEEPSIETADNISSPSAEITSEWLTYTNSEMGYSVKYPNEWLINENSSKTVYLLTKERNEALKNKKIVRVFDVLIQSYKTVSELPDNNKNLNLNDWIIQRQQKNLVTKKEPTTLSGINGYLVTENGETSGQLIYLQNNNIIYVIETDSEIPSEVEQNIINSLKFN